MNPDRDPWDGIESRAAREKRDGRYTIVAIVAIIFATGGFWGWVAWCRISVLLK